MNRPTVYLAGPITGLTFESAIDWRERVTEELADLGIICLNPLRGKNYLLRGAGVLHHGVLETDPMTSGKGSVAQDRWDIQRSEVVFANFEGTESVSIGTVLEFGWADTFGTPIVAVIPPGNVHDHPMLRELAGWAVAELESGIDIVRALVTT